MERDRTTWANPIRAQRVVEELEKRLGTDTETSGSDSAEPWESFTALGETPD
jgi:hypothetical protein